MLEYFTYKKVKKSREEKAEKERLATEQAPVKPPRPTPSPGTSTIVSKPVEQRSIGTPLLEEEDEKFLQRIISPADEEDGPPPPLPPRVPTPAFTWDSDAESAKSQGSTAGAGKGKGKDTATLLDTKDADKKPQNKRFSVITNNIKTEISRVLDDLNLSAQNNKVFSLSADSTEMVRKFNLVLQDLINGVPTAYDDLVKLLEDRDSILAKNYEKLPKSLKKLVTQLPNKLTTTLAPELLAVAAEAQGLNAAEASKGGIKGAAKSFLTPKSLQELVTKPGAVVGLLKGIVNALKTRWPAFIGTNVLWSVALFLLLSALWYCHKRGRETRLEKEAAEKDPIDGSTRIEELPDDPMLPAPGQGANLATPPFGSRSGSGKTSPVPVYAKSGKK
ncbi:hypothetical protein BJ170DRAFT_612867 [Xylariales sp. AK1849]|nr:hypothetical protein BJ170DRAFT_612867 [Xylariales sp. AK1849]